MKKKCSLVFGILSLSSVLTVAHAANCGAYIGAGAGYGFIKTPNKNIYVGTPALNETNNFGGLSGRAFAGFNFTNFFGIEGGYARYARSRYSATDAGESTSLRYHVRTADLVAKLYLPVGQSPLNLYALAGAVSYWEQIKTPNDSIGTVNNFAQPAPVTTNQRRTRPIYGLGIALAPFKHFTANVEYTLIQKLGSFSTNILAVPTTTLVTLNFAYNFC